VCDVVLALAPRVRPELAVDRALALALVHDAPEALTGDLPRVAADLLPEGAKRTAEAAAAERLFATNPLALERWREYRERRTREARFVAVCDRLQLGVRLVAYRRAGVGGLDEFRDGLEALACDGFEPAEELRQELLAALDRV
jgi:5'-deoxynucleotidase YfbR-like HD superfamily hydrolase